LISRPPLALRVPAIDVGGPHFELERRGHAVGRLVAVGLVALAVLVKIDETGCDDETAGVERLTALDRALAIAAIFPPLMPTLRTASSPDSGSTTRPFRMTRSKSCASSDAIPARASAATRNTPEKTARFTIVVLLARPPLLGLAAGRDRPHHFDLLVANP